jgi:hypothetical protein
VVVRANLTARSVSFAVLASVAATTDSSGVGLAETVSLMYDKLNPGDFLSHINPSTQTASDLTVTVGSVIDTRHTVANLLVS